ncbi:hypothetical protein FB451DRAFT_1186903 [Mycena latifolia]|nr:hypothetical protein FB451DRAFT_1186903 [Mycena latifolia]
MTLGILTRPMIFEGRSPQFVTHVMFARRSTARLTSLEAEATAVASPSRSISRASSASYGPARTSRTAPHAGRLIDHAYPAHLDTIHAAPPSRHRAIAPAPPRPPARPSDAPLAALFRGITPPSASLHVLVSIICTPSPMSGLRGRNTRYARSPYSQGRFASLTTRRSAFARAQNEARRKSDITVRHRERAAGAERLGRKDTHTVLGCKRAREQQLDWESEDSRGHIPQRRSARLSGARQRRSMEHLAACRSAHSSGGTGCRGVRRGGECAASRARERWAGK